jgi:hypothetical protein
MGYLFSVLAHCANPRRGRRAEGVLLYITLQPRSMLDIARPAGATLLANLCKRLNDFDERSLAAAYLASGICGNALNRRMSRQCMHIQPPPSLTGTVRASHY